MKVRSGRVPSLDGLRALSITLVLVSHMIGTRGLFIPQSVGKFFALGELGVRVFFVISGFLITSLLLEELESDGKINLVRFYFRRTLRILPPYFVMVFVVILLEAGGWIALSPRDKLHALTYTANYYPERSWYLGHTWSLAVEEQFYLLWPALLILAGKRRGLAFALVLLFACPFIRLGLWWLNPQAAGEVGTRFEGICDSIAIGCVLAGTREWLHSQKLYKSILNSRLLLIVPFVVLAASALHDRPRIDFFVGFTVMNVGIVLCIDWCITNCEGRIGRMLNARPIAFIGVISYSIYLWQQIFLNRSSTSTFTRFPVNIIFAIAAALLSYYIVERPSLRLRRNLELRQASRDKNVGAGLVPARIAERQSNVT
ncbi:MAG TPA: acyltransferase [Blastocatellia bacterium]|nr:acyltransferase [Blastocatellia bacterium]